MFVRPSVRPSTTTSIPRSHCCCYFCFSCWWYYLSLCLLLQPILFRLFQSEQKQTHTHTLAGSMARWQKGTQNNVHWQTVAIVFLDPLSLLSFSCASQYRVFRLKLWAIYSFQTCTTWRALDPRWWWSLFIVSVHWSLIFLTTAAVAAYLFTCHNARSCLFIIFTWSLTKIHSRLSLLLLLLFWLCNCVFLTTC